LQESKAGAFRSGYDVRAKVADADVPAWGRLSNGSKQMALQALLAERFHLVARRVMKEGKVYELVVAKGGPKFKGSLPPETDPSAPPSQMGAQFLGHNTTMGQFASSLSNLGVSRPAVDKTGLTGMYEFRFRLDPNSSPQDPGPSDSSIIDALREQLGLDLKPSTGPVESLVIDHIERPAEN
jgi:uncharacterized protein (TIGR03435 family)